MNLYEINQAIMEAFERWIEPETGEILDIEAEAELEALQMERDSKIENIALWIKNLDAEAEALKAEKQAFADRQRRAEKKAESLRRYLTNAMDGEKFSTNRVAISWRRSESVALDPNRSIFDVDTHYLKIGDPVLDKAAIKAALKAGQEIDGVHLETKNSIQIK